jgi:DNA adenine methylase
VAAAQLGRATAFVLNDVHAPLIALWREIILRPDEISAKYAAIWRAQLGEERLHYDRVRSRFNRFQRPEDFLYLLARCVKAAIRWLLMGPGSPGRMELEWG